MHAARIHAHRIIPQKEAQLQAHGLTLSSVLLVPVWIVNELPMQLLCFLCVKLLPAFWTLEGASHLDTDVLDSTVAGLCRICDFQCLRHAYASS